MDTNLELDPDLLREAQLLGGHRSARATVEAALQEYVRQRKAKRILLLFGKVPIKDYEHRSH